MEIKYKKETSDSITEKESVPVTASMKQTLMDLKNRKKNPIDVNAMTRDYWQMLIDKDKTLAKG